MSTYAIGDIQGCFATLTGLLRRIDFRPGNDRLWLCGDLVNRGPDSLAVLRWAHSLGATVTCVLGNHDLHLLALANGHGMQRHNDTLNAALCASDRDILFAWLARQPLVHHEGTHALVHAGILPCWTVREAVALSQEIAPLLCGAKAKTFFSHLSHDVGERWGAHLQDWARAVFITKALTYMRVCSATNELFLDFTDTPDKAPAGTKPWFAFPERKSLDTTIICGHWSALGLHTENNIRAIDTGCVWGGSLTAYRLEDGTVFSEPVS